MSVSFFCSNTKTMDQPPDSRPLNDPEVLPDARPKRPFEYNGKVYDSYGEAYEAACNEHGPTFPTKEPSIQEEEELAIDPEDFCGNAHIVCVGKELLNHIKISIQDSVWATVYRNVGIARELWHNFAVLRKTTQPMFVMCSYPDAGNKLVHGVFLMTGPPQELIDPKDATAEQLKDPWSVKGIFHGKFPVQWLLFCDNDKNVMVGRYELNEKRDFSSLEKGSAQELVRELKKHVGADKQLYLKANVGLLVLKRINDLIAKDNGCEPSPLKRERGANPIKIEYEETEKLSRTSVSSSSAEVELEPLKDLEKIFRGPIPSRDYWDPSVSDLSFEIIDQDYCDMPSMDAKRGSAVVIESFHSPVAPVLRLYGCTKEGYSVVASVRNFSPYFYVRAPSSIVDLLRYPRYDNEVKAQLDMEATNDLGKEDSYTPGTLLQKIASSIEAVGACHNFSENLSKQIIAGFDYYQKKRFGYATYTRRFKRPNGGDNDDEEDNRFNADDTPNDDPVLRTLLVRRESIVGLKHHLDWFLKVILISPHFVKPARKILEDGFVWFVNEQGKPHAHVRLERYQVFEANIPFALRYMIDVEQMGPCWVTLPKTKYIRWNCDEAQRATWADIEVLTEADDVVVHPTSDPLWSDHAPVRSITLDAEMDGLDGRFPVPDLNQGDPVLCISVRVSNEVPDQDKQLVGDVLFSWGLTSDIGVSHMMCYYQRRNEAQIDEIAKGLNSPQAKMLRCGASRIKKGTYAYWTPNDERAMLRQFRDFIIHIARPFVITGYNVNNFDFPYLFKRASRLGMGQEFDCFGWIKGQRTKVRQKIFSSKAFGSRVNHELNMPGRVMVDALHLIQRNFKQRSYSLNGSLARHMGTDAEGKPNYVKADVPHEMIGFLWNHSPDSRARVAYYCHYDVVLSRMIYDKLYLYLDNIELAGAAGVPVKYIIERGIQIRVLSLILRKAKVYLLLAPVASEDKNNVEEDQYKGATVIDPITGFYVDPIFTLDFTSLYPTIMIAHNFCYCTWINREDQNVKLLTDQMYRINNDQGVDHFAKQSVRIGVFPMVLEALLSARNKAKEMVKKHGKTPKGKMYDLRQLALKLIANGGYGMAGAKKGLLALRAISASVTRIGREGIDTVAQVATRPYLPFPRSFVEFADQYHARVKTKDWPMDPIKHKPEEVEAVRMAYLKNRLVESSEQYEKRCQEARAAYPIPRLPDETLEQHRDRILETIDFVYGDTDSIMVLCKKCKTAEDAMKLGKAMALWITKYFFHPPMAILFEKIYWPFLLFAKKRYAGIKWENLSDKPKKDSKGLESVRRDNAPVVAKLVDNVIDSLLKDKSIEKAVNIVKAVVQSILDGSIDVSSLIISKSLSKPPREYDQSAPHVELSLKMMKRDLNTAPRMGDRVPYVMVARGGKSKDIKACEKAEDPLWTIEHDLQIDRTYYLMQQLYNPMERILDPLIPGITAKLFSTSPCTIYLPPDISVLSKKLLTARTSTGSDEGLMANAISATGVAQPSAVSTTPPPPPPPPPPPAPPKAKLSKAAAKLVPGQRSISAMFLQDNSGPEVLRPLDPHAPLKSWVKPPPKKKPEVLAGQMDVSSCLMITTPVNDSLPAAPATKLLKKTTRDITKPKEGYIAVNIRYKIVISTPIKSKDSIGLYGRLKPKCVTCGLVISADNLTAEDLANPVVAPVCKACRIRWAEQQRDANAELEKLTTGFKELSIQADKDYRQKWKICCDCQKVKTIEDVPDCSARECSNFYPRMSAKSRRSKYDNTLRRLEAHTKKKPES